MIGPGSDERGAKTGTSKVYLPASGVLAAAGSVTNPVKMLAVIPETGSAHPASRA